MMNIFCIYLLGCSLFVLASYLPFRVGLFCFLSSVMQVPLFTPPLFSITQWTLSSFLLIVHQAQRFPIPFMMGTRCRRNLGLGIHPSAAAHGTIHPPAYVSLNTIFFQPSLRSHEDHSYATSSSPSSLNPPVPSMATLDWDYSWLVACEFMAVGTARLAWLDFEATCTGGWDAGMQK